MLPFGFIHIPCRNTDLYTCSGIFTSIDVQCKNYLLISSGNRHKPQHMYELFVEFMNQIFFEGYVETLSTEEFNEEFNQFKLTYS